MKIKYYRYNSFTIENKKVKIVIDPGRDLLWYKLNSLIPRPEWEGVTHILVTHGDPDHFVFTVPMAKKSKAQVICHEELAEDIASEKIDSVRSIDVGEVIDLKDFQVKGLKVVHGPLEAKLLFGLVDIKAEKQVHSHGTIKLLFGLIKLEKDDIDFARGSMGFKITIDNKIIVNLGDSLPQKEWEGLEPDILMIPIGGGMSMDQEEALEAVRSMAPKKVIPCHYNNDLLWQRNFYPADDQLFKREVEKMGIECTIMEYGDEIEV
ncbi:MBL fold metallo-hydrolase [Methanolobus sp. WCC4]|uniref:MBL fold metallo-hydrolase n=1 Tax=Methanolobus sp. WCC4 TaxID=3125784 RepID=UPI0030F86398